MSVPARALFENAIEQSQRIAEKAAEEHLQAFKMQMREKTGVENIALSEPYLPFALVRAELDLLRRLEKLEIRPASVKLLQLEIYPVYDGQEGDGEDEDNFSEDSDFEDDEEDDSPDSQWDLEIGRETNRSILSLKQDLDSKRQQAFGIRKYVWQGGDCAECAAKDGEIFEWGDGDEPGGIHPNCQCSADPVTDGEGEAPKQNAVFNPTPEQMLDMALLVASFTPYGGPFARAALALRRLGKVGEQISRMAEQMKPGSPKPPAKPEALPKPQPKLNDTTTWPKPPSQGKFREGNPSRAKPRSRGEKSLYDENGGEWRYDPGDKYHNPHWNYKPPGQAQEWQNIPIDNLPYLKNWNFIC